MDRVEEALSFGGVEMVELLGGIGVGKSVLVAALEPQCAQVAPETIPFPMLERYLAEARRDPIDQDVLQWAANAFQREMLSLGMGRWYKRPAAARTSAGALRRPLHVVERPWYSNKIFAVANRVLDRLSKDDYGAYLAEIDRFVRENRFALRNEVRTGRTVSFFLWAPLEMRRERIAERARAGEDGYGETYLELLDHTSFILLLLSWIQNAQNATMSAIIPLDWRNYGHPRDLSRACVSLNASSDELQAPEGKEFVADINQYLTIYAVDKGHGRMYREELMAELCHCPIDAVTLKISSETEAYIRCYFATPIAALLEVADEGH